MRDSLTYKPSNHLSAVNAKDICVSRIFFLVSAIDKQGIRRVDSFLEIPLNVLAHSAFSFNPIRPCAAGLDESLGSKLVLVLASQIVGG